MQQHFHFFFVIPFSQISTRNLLPRTALKSVYPGVFPPMMERFFLCYGDETPGNVKPSGEHDSRFGGGSSEWFAQGNVQAWAVLAEHYFFQYGYTRILLLCPGLLSSDIPLTCCVSCSAHTAFSRMLCATRPTAQTGTRIRWQCAPSNGSLATVCGNIRGSCTVENALR